MKIYTVQTQDGQIMEMSFAKVIKYKNKGKPVLILGVAKEIDKSYKNRGNNGN